ncbi:MAG: acetyl-CoA carboxylase biotin carboxyl carrier protein [Ignavibacteria bacterium]|nr:acetyl-CoA carboxylase biotin carboxyl carrier protein [Ignavibacteria bacterium]
MDINLLKKLIKMVEQSEITDFSVQEGDLKVKISKNTHNAANFSFQTPIEYSRPMVQSNAAIPIVESPSVEIKRETKSDLHEVKSPIVGTFYRAPAPDADPYVEVGDSIATGTVLCIVEAMKLLNEIESDVNGKIVKILVENATPVEYGQPLFLIDTK